MKFKLTLLLLLIFSKSSGQAKLYYNDLNLQVEKSDATYYRIIENHPVEKNKYIAKDYYLTDTLKQLGSYSDKEIFTKDGFFTSYFTNGQKNSEGFYKDNRQVGKWYKWYKNGKPKEEGFYDVKNDPYLRYKVENFWDSLGNQLVKNGNGDYQIEENDDELSHGKGKVVNGLKSGTWIGYFKDGKIAYQEEYKENKFLNGISFDTKGKEYKYDQVFESNLNPFYNTVMRNLKYPAQARRNGIQGQVIIQIIIDQAGEIILSRIVKGIGGGCDEEALRVVNSFNGKWGDGKRRGQQLKFKKPQSMYLPITFKLG